MDLAPVVNGAGRSQAPDPTWRSVGLCVQIDAPPHWMSPAESPGPKRVSLRKRWVGGKKGSARGRIGRQTHPRAPHPPRKVCLIMRKINTPGNGSSSYDGGLGDHNDPRSLGLTNEGEPQGFLADGEGKSQL